ncbi:MAG: 16S rRNA pseudouridine(516) synthase [Phenylobacterium zucineum]|nr:MAG: 16S rRNA pseudouridine(516) synthase [Phenylobacterium zucineum]
MSRPPMARLDRLLANLGYGSRREVAALARAGRIVLNGRPLTESGAKVPVTADLPLQMTINGVPVDPPAPLTLIMNKPLGVVCSHKEPGRSVYDLLPHRWRARMPGLSTVGRLDKDTSGLLLITDDGPFLHRVISPRSHVPKRYRAELARPLNGREGELFASGTLVLEGENDPLAPADLIVTGPQSADLIITEGRYHQVRRMFAAVGNHVVLLHREQIGGLTLPEDLEPGAWHLLPAEDQAAIFS